MGLLADDLRDKVLRSPGEPSLSVNKSLLNRMDPKSILNMLAEIRKINDTIRSAGDDRRKIEEGERKLITFINDHGKEEPFLWMNPGIEAALVRIANQLKDKHGGEVPKEVTLFLQRIHARRSSSRRSSRRTSQRGGATRRQKLKRARRTRR